MTLGAARLGQRTVSSAVFHLAAQLVGVGSAVAAGGLAFAVTLGLLV